MAKLNLEDLMDKKETPAEETKEIVTTMEPEAEETEKFNVGDVVYLLHHYEPKMLVHNLTVPDEDETWIEVVWVNNNGELVFSVLSMLCLTHTRPDEPAHNPPM